MKIKIGTQLEEDVYRSLKIAAARENRAIGEVIQAAVASYLQRRATSSGKASGLNRLLEPDPLQLKQDRLRRTMEADFFDQ
jgi:hypothetical protein